MLTRKELGELAKLPLCPRCGDTKHVEEWERYPSLIGTYIRYRCKDCMVTWEGRADDFTIPNPPGRYDYLMSKYRELHNTCPECGWSGDWCTTLLAFKVETLETMKDPNHTSCPECGWRGRVYELKAGKCEDFDDDGF